MGTRADFYVGRGKTAEWLGSIAYDGYPDGQPEPILVARTEKSWRAKVAGLLKRLDDATTPDQGWPWPWEDSGTTDYAYAFDGGRVWASAFGAAWFDATKPKPTDDADTPKIAVFPNMKSRQNVTLGRRSGLLIIGG